MADRVAKDHVEFFRKVGNNYVHPKAWGDCIFPVTVEELYQHFKARLIDEVEAVQKTDTGIHQVFPLRAGSAGERTGG